MEHRGLPSREGCLHAVLEQEIARARLGASSAPSSELRRLPVAKGPDEIPNRIKSVQLVSLECLSRHTPGSRKGGLYFICWLLWVRRSLRPASCHLPLFSWLPPSISSPRTKTGLSPESQDCSSVTVAGVSKEAGLRQRCLCLPYTKGTCKRFRHPTATFSPRLY